jgi:hypothetical protein
LELCVAEEYEGHGKRQARGAHRRESRRRRPPLAHGCSSGEGRALLPLAQSAGEKLPHAAGEPRRLTDGKGLWHAHHGSWSPDGRTVFYARDDFEGDIYLIENYR